MLAEMPDKLDPLVNLSISSHLIGAYRVMMQALKHANTDGKTVVVIDTSLNSGARGSWEKSDGNDGTGFDA